jgi:SAM-dependent methyltransferase
LNVPPELRCLAHAALLAAEPGPAVEDSAALVCASGCRVPVEGGVPRFVAGESYAAGFGLQWTAHPRTQLDSATGTRISRDRLARCLGGLEKVAGRSVLEVGCGAGRFTEVLLDAGARVFACDLSRAVEANHASFRGRAGYFVCQADLMALPVAPAAFDVVLALGVLQHTPRPEAAARALASALRPGGLLALDHYARPAGAGLAWSIAAALSPRALLRQVVVRLPPRTAEAVAAGVTRVLLPLHRRLWRRGPIVDRARWLFRRVSPVVDHYDRLPELSPEQLAEWSVLDTHDALTDRYKHVRTADEVRAFLSDAGLVEIEAGYGGNGVEARGRKPLGKQRSSVHGRIRGS